MKYRTKFISILVVALILVLSVFNVMKRNPTAEQQIPIEPSNIRSNVSYWVANGTQIDGSSYDQLVPQLCWDGEGGAYIVWQSSTGSTTDIRAQRITNTGLKIGGPIGVPVCVLANNQIIPQICSDGAGGALITWQDFQNGVHYDITAQRINSSLNLKWNVPSQGTVVCNAAGHQEFPQICSDGTGGAIVIWQDFRSGSYWDIYAQRVSSAGYTQWTPNGIPICTAANDQISPQIISDSSGGAIITWWDKRGGATYDIYAQRINSAGIIQWAANGTAVCTASYDQKEVQICSDESGGAIITWQDFRSGSYWDIYAQRVNSSGSMKWTNNGVAICTASYNQVYPQLCISETGGALITWVDNRGGIDYDVYAQSISQSGTVQWTINGIVICDAFSTQYYPQICSDGARGAFITWYDTRSSFEDIYAQRVTPFGELKWITNGIPICTAANTQRLPQICSNSIGGAIITWEDLRSGYSYDIYAQVVDPSGQPDFIIETPIGLYANPYTWSKSNFFSVYWLNPFDPSGIVGAYYKLDSAPTSNFDGNYVAFSQISYLSGITVSGNGSHNIYVWLVDGANNIDYRRRATTTLYLDNSISAPTGISATPSSATTTNSFNVSWTNPSDLAGIVGAYYKLGSPPTSPTDGFYIDGINITSIKNIWLPEYGIYTIYVWLKDAVGNVDFSKYASTTLNFSEPPSKPIPFSSPLIQLFALVITILGLYKLRTKSISKIRTKP